MVPLKTLTDGFSIPVYGLGTWQLQDYGDESAIRAAIDAGVTHIDTAELYGNGRSEELVAKAVKNRSSIFIATKASPGHQDDKKMRTALHDSLKRLNTDYVDLYMPHVHDLAVPLEETFGTLNDLVDEGLVRNIGVSNYSADTLANASKMSKYPIRVNQVHYNLIIRTPETTGLLKYCQDNDVFLNAYRPLQLGGYADEGFVTDRDDPLVDSLAKKYEKSPAQIHINWLVSQSNVIALSKTRSVEHLQENLGALDWKMDDEDIELLRSDFPGQSNSGDNPLT